MTRIGLWAITGGCLVAVLVGGGVSERRVAGAEPAENQQTIPGDLPPELQAIRESLGGSAVEHFPSLRPRTDELSPWTSLSWAGAGVIRSVLVHCGLPFQAAAEPTAVSEPAALPPVIATATAPSASIHVPVAWPSTAHAPIPTGWAPQPATAPTPSPPTPTPAFAPAPYFPSAQGPVRAPAASPYPLAQAAATGVLSATAQPPAAPDPASPLRVLRSTASHLDETAHRLEEMELYEQADSLREVAQKLRVDARSMATPAGTIAPTPAQPTPTQPTQATSSPWPVGEQTVGEGGLMLFRREHGPNRPIP
jgi:hypothetical protein